LRFIWTVITTVLLLFGSIIVFHPGNPDGIEPSREPTDPPIRIDSDTDLESQATANGWPGSGTESDPFIIENYTIEGTDEGYCIYIGNTTNHFVIRNCTVSNASYSDQYQYSQFSKYYGENGINLYNVENGILKDLSSSGNLGHGACLDLNNGIISNSNLSINGKLGLHISGDEVRILENDFVGNGGNGLVS
jgi:hypothetical protein